MMRADTYPGPGYLDDLRRCWNRVDRGILPRFGELDALVNSDDLLDTAGLDAGVVRPRTTPTTSLTFLPSRHGSGCDATITGYWGQHEPDGWIVGDYGDLRGIAIEPVRIPMKPPGYTDLKPPAVPISKRPPFQSQTARDGVVS